MRAVRTLAAWLAGFFVLLVLSAWLVPPLLDWGRYSTAIASIAGAKLGRRVAIGGAVRLRLFPEAVLTASDVSLPDEGDGLAAKLASLRLRVALGPLLAGRIVARDLVLDHPVLRLPWPLPASLLDPPRPPVPNGFAARLEGGSLTIGQLRATGITAALQGQRLEGGLGASGEFTVSDRSWRFEGRLGAPDAQGGAALAMSVRGQESLSDTTGRFTGRLSGDALRGELDLSGKDLSRLGPAPRLAWRLRGPVSATGERIEAPALALTGGDAWAGGSATLNFAPLHLDLKVATPSIALAAWVAPLRLADHSALPATFSFSAGKAPLLAGVVSDLDIQVSADAAGARLDHASAGLPGNARAWLSGQFTHAKSGVVALEGPGRLEAPDLVATLRWLGPLAPALAAAMPQGPAVAARINGSVSVQQARIAIDGLAGTLGGGAVSGTLSIGGGSRPDLAADLRLDQLSLGGVSISDAMRRSGDPGFDADVRLRARSASLLGLTLTDFALEGHGDASGTGLARLEGDEAGAHVSASGRLDPRGAIGDGRLAISTAQLATSWQALPEAWRGRAPAWNGSADVEIKASGPPQSLSLQVRGNAGDLRLEAESLLDLTGRSGAATLTLRHPGTPRLLSDLGFPGTQAWLDTGSFALRTHLQASPGHVLVRDFDLNAASVRLGGRADIDLSRPATRLDASIDAESLALPGWAAWRDLPLRAGWMGGLAGRLDVRARACLIGLRPVARDLSGRLSLEQGIFLADPVTATIADGQFTGQAAVDFAASPGRLGVQGALDGAMIDGALTSLPVDPVSGAVDARLAADASGATPAGLAGTLSGTLHLALRQATVAGIDLSRLARALGEPASRRETDVRAAMTTGASTGFGGTIDAAITSGALVLPRARLLGPSGAIEISGGIDPLAQTADLQILAVPDVPLPPGVGISLAGSWAHPQQRYDLSQALAWGSAASVKPVSRPKGRAPRRPRHPRP